MAEMNDGSGLSAAERDKAVQEKLERLKAEHTKLNELKIATARDRKNLEEQLQALREKAEKEYGTSDLDQLRALLEQRRQENEAMVRDYGEHIAGIKEKLQAIDREKKEGKA